MNEMNEMNDIASCGIVIILIITSPITLPIAGIIYIGSKIYDKCQENKVALLRKLIIKKMHLHKSWDSKNIILGYSIKNTDIIIVDATTSYFAFLNQIEQRWLESRNFIIVQVDIDNVDFNTLETLYKYIYSYDTNTIKIFNRSTKKSTLINNIENNSIRLINYYGIINNKFKCEYY